MLGGDSSLLSPKNLGGKHVYIVSCCHAHPSIHPSIHPPIHPSIRQFIDNSSTKQKMRTLTEETRAATDLERLWPAGVILEDGAAKAITRVEEFDWRATEAVPALEATRAAVKATILIDCCR